MQARPDVTSFSEKRQRLCFALASIASLQNLHGTRVHRLRKFFLVRDRARPRRVGVRRYVHVVMEGGVSGRGLAGLRSA